MKIHSNVAKNEQGMIAIAVTIIIVSLTSLIVIGFATLSRREQRQSLDRQLSAQAYYAAETGVNYLADRLRDGQIAGDKTDCNAGRPEVSALNSDNVEYTCALVYQEVDSLIYRIKKDESKIVPINTSATIGAIEISWQDSEGKSRFAINNGHFLPQSDFNLFDPNTYPNHSPILRTTIIPISGSMTRASLMNSSQTIFMYPQDSPGAANNVFTAFGASPGAGTQGRFLDATCSTTPGTNYFCRARVNNITALSPTRQIYLRLKPIYQGADVQIKVFGTDGAQLGITGSQAVVDVTARATDVVKRVQARFPLGKEYYIPEFGIQTADSICKRLETWPARGGSPAGQDFNVPTRPNPKAPLDINPAAEQENCDPEKF